ADWGLVSRVTPADRLLEEGRAFAAQLASGPTLAYAATKRILRAWRSSGVSAADQVTHAEGPRVILSDDLQSGVASLQGSGLGHRRTRGRGALHRDPRHARGRVDPLLRRRRPGQPPRRQLRRRVPPRDGLALPLGRAGAGEDGGGLGRALLVRRPHAWRVRAR